MTYHGVKFRTKILENDPPRDARIAELKTWCNKLSASGLSPSYGEGSHGNLSFRTEEKKSEFIITGSRIDLGSDLKEDAFVRVASCDLDKGVIYASGALEPSSESMLHFAIYRERKDVNAVFHGHAQSLLNRKNLLSTKKEAPYGTLELVNSVLEVIGEENFLIIKNHGFISLGASMEEAGRRALMVCRERKL